MNPLAALRELGVGVWLLARAGRGVALDVVERDDLARDRLADALSRLVWRPLPTLMLLAALSGLIAGLGAAQVLGRYHAELLVLPALAQALARDVVPLVLGVFAAGRVSVELASRLGGMGLRREIDALTALGHDPARYALSPALAAVVLAAPVHMLAATASAFAAAGLALSGDAVVPMGRYLELTRADDTARAALTGTAKALLFTLIAAAVGAAVGSRETRNASELAERATVAFTVGLLAIFTAAALWTALL